MRILLILLAGVFFAQCGNLEQKNVDATFVAQDLDVEAFALKMKETPGIVLDVRTPEEVQRGKIKGAVEMDFYADDFEQQLATLDSTQVIFVYCAKGGRSSKAMDLLSNMGCKTVYNLDGGMGAWLGAKMPVEN